MKTTVRFTFSFLLLIILISSCEKDKPNCIEEDQVSYHNIEQKYKDLVPFGQPGFSMELTDSASGQKVKFTFNGIDSGYWEDKVHNGNANCGWFYANNYQYFHYNCVSSNDSLLQLNLFLLKQIGDAFYYSSYFDLLTYDNATDQIGVIVEENGLILGIQFFNDLNYSKFYPELEINNIKYKNVLVSNINKGKNLPIVYFNNVFGIIAIRTPSKLFQLR